MRGEWREVNGMMNGPDWLNDWLNGMQIAGGEENSQEYKYRQSVSAVQFANRGAEVIIDNMILALYNIEPLYYSFF